MLSNYKLRYIKTTKQQKSECFTSGRTDIELKDPETKLCKHGNYFQKGGKTIQWGKIFHKWCWDYWVFTVTGSCLTIYTKLNSEWIKDKNELNYKSGMVS